MQRIKEYVLNNTPREGQILDLPIDGDILSVGLKGEQLILFVMVNSLETATSQRKILIRASDCEIAEKDIWYIGTICTLIPFRRGILGGSGHQEMDMQQCILHVFEVFNWQVDK